MVVFTTGDDSSDGGGVRRIDEGDCIACCCREAVSCGVRGPMLEAPITLGSSSGGESGS